MDNLLSIMRKNHSQMRRRTDRNKTVCGWKTHECVLDWNFDKNKRLYQEGLIHLTRQAFYISLKQGGLYEC